MEATQEGGWMATVIRRGLQKKVSSQRLYFEIFCVQLMGLPCLVSAAVWSLVQIF